MVSLGVAEISSSHIKMPMGQSESLRDTALWYPEIPEPGLYLNEDCFTGEDPSTVGYRPLCWTLFGGSGGIYLRCLTEISATCLGSLCGIEFHYNTDEVPSRWRRLGLRKSTEYSHVMRFPVDGPGGEIIKKVEVGLESPHSKYANSCKHGKWRSFKVTLVLLEPLLETDVFLIFVEYYRFPQIARGLFTFSPHRIRQMCLR